MSEPIESPGSVSFALIESPRARIATFSGVVDDRLLCETYRELTASPDFDPMLPDLIDLRAVTRLLVTSTGLRTLIHDFELVYRHTAQRRVAIVAVQDVVYGMARMYGLLRGVNPPEKIQIFRNYPEAVDWVGGSPPLGTGSAAESGGAAP